MPQATIDTAAKPLEFHPSADFDHLLDIARDHIRDLAGRVWTDHNTHDPGITILEVLSFAIADLSYRTSFDVKDLIAGYTGDKDLPIDLPLADVALPNHPFTVKDLRKVLLDLAHPQKTKQLLLRNVWPMVATESEVDLFLVAPGEERGYLSLLGNVGPKTPKETDDTKVSPKQYEQPVKTASSSSTYRDEPLRKALPATHTYQEEALPPTTKFIHSTKSPDDKAMPAKVPQKTPQQSPVPSAPKQPAALLPDDKAQASNFPKETPGKTPNPGNYTLPTIGESQSLQRTTKPDANRKALQLNGLYGLQLEFEDEYEDLTLPYYLADLNQNYFRSQVQAKGQSFELSVLFPYWDQVNQALKDVDLNQAPLVYNTRPNTQQPYFIGVDKLNYDDHFYDYFAEILLDGHLLTAFVNISTPTRAYIEVGGRQFPFEMKWMDWNELANGVDMNYTGVTYTTPQIEFVGTDASDLVYDIQVNFQQGGKTYPLLGRAIFDEGQALPNHYTVADELRQEFGDLYRLRIDLEVAIRTELVNRQSALHLDYQDKLKHVYELVYGPKGAWDYLGDYRNLSEDFAAFSASRVQEIALFGKLLLAPGYNANQILGEVFFQIDQFLHPLVKFHSLDEITAKGYAFDEVFNGPLLQHGFIEDKDLENLQRRSVIYTSDLIRIIMDVEGVEAVEDFSISSYIDNRLMGRKVTNCLSLTYAEVYRPRLSAPKSGLQLLSGGVQEMTDTDQINEWYLRRLRELKSAQLPGLPAYDLALPTGTARDTAHYHSIQNDFPQIYGIGPFGLPQDASPDRKARAKQLKAFLLPFEQILANYLKQISHLPELFSFNATATTTYPHTPLYDVPAVAPLFRPYLQSGDTWENFKTDTENAYRTQLKENESKATWLNRRNRFLDHLLGRFAEGFSKYAMQLFNQHKGLLDPMQPQQMDLYEKKRLAEMDRLIADKIAFAEDFPKVSMQRSRAFNYGITNQPGSSWESENVSGYKRRICRLLGLRITGHFPIFNQPDPNKPSNRIDLEGLHVVEHILLRPRSAQASLFPVINQNDGEGFYIYDSERDPYSFRVTVVLPASAGRFQNEQFRAFAEDLIREETPAHILVDIKWMNGRCGEKFEKTFAQWLKQTATIKPYLLQNILTKGDAKRQRFNRPLQSYFEAQNQLVNALQTTCKLSISAYDANQRLMKPVFGKVHYELSQKDIFFLEVSEAKGKMEVLYRRDPNTDWKEIASYKRIATSWFSVSKITGDKAKGLVAGLRGTGQYHLVYTVENTSESLILDVVPGKPVTALSIRYSDLENAKDIAQPDRSGRIVLQPQQVKLALDFLPPGGTLRISNGNPSPSQRMLPFVEISPVKRFEFDLRDYEVDKVNKLFLVEYEFNGESIANLLDYQGEVKVEEPTLILNANGKAIEKLPAVINPFDDKVIWSFTFAPVGGMLKFYQLVKDERHFFGEEEVTEKNKDDKLEVKDIWGMKGDGLYEAEYVTAGGKAIISFRLEKVEKTEPEGIDPRFKLNKVEEVETKVFVVYPVPLRYTGKTYIWRVNDKYTSRSKAPKIKLDFREMEEIELQLGVFLDGESKIHEMMLSAEALREMK